MSDESSLTSQRTIVFAQKVHGSFPALGGRSITFLQSLNAAHQTIGFDLPLQLVFVAATLRACRGFRDARHRLARDCRCHRARA
jgi:hypothetical protein